MQTTDIIYANDYGRARLTPVTAYLPLAELPKAHQMADNCFFSVDDAERLALITGNHRIQCAFAMDRTAFYVVHHNSSDTAALCRMQIEYFACDQSPQAEIEQANSRSSLFPFWGPA
jgi:hypothetical protein